jgi:hypothetical protein
MLEVALSYVVVYHLFRSGRNILVQDLAVYKIIGEMSNLEIAEMCARSGANCGSLFLDFRFRELVKTLLADHPAHRRYYSSVFNLIHVILPPHCS